MWRNKKVIIIAVVAAVVLFGSIGGVALAQTGSGDASQPKAPYETLLDKVCKVYEEKTGVAIDSETLKEAFDKAQSEMRSEALQGRLQYLVEQGKISQEQADQYFQWQQSMPEMPSKAGLGGPGRFPGMGGKPGFGGHDKFPGMRGMPVHDS